MKRPTLKVIDFDSVVQNTKSSKSIILMSAFSNILLQSRSSEATNIGYRFSSRAVFGWILFELNSGCGYLRERLEVFCLLSEYCRQIFLSYYYIQAGQIISPIPSHFRVSRRHQFLSQNPPVSISDLIHCIQLKLSSQSQKNKRAYNPYLWPGSKCWM